MADVVVSSGNTNAKELLGQGIRAYILQDYNSAVTALSKASELLVAEHGDDMHDSLADVYLYYGKSLLGLSREDSEALGIYQWVCYVRHCFLKNFWVNI